jgi:predicted HicB family RNase H-like nuclease
MAKETTKSFTMRIPPELFRRLNKEAKLQKKSRTQLVRSIVDRYVTDREMERDYDRTGSKN